MPRSILQEAISIHILWGSIVSWRSFFSRRGSCGTSSIFIFGECARRTKRQHSPSTRSSLHPGLYRKRSEQKRTFVKMTSQDQKRVRAMNLSHLKMGLCGCVRIRVAERSRWRCSLEWRRELSQFCLEFYGLMNYLLCDGVMGKPVVTDWKCFTLDFSFLFFYSNIDSLLVSWIENCVLLSVCGAEFIDFQFLLLWIWFFNWFPENWTCTESFSVCVFRN